MASGALNMNVNYLVQTLDRLSTHWVWDGMNLYSSRTWSQRWACCHFTTVKRQIYIHLKITASSSRQLYGLVSLYFPLTLLIGVHFFRRAICWEKLLLEPLRRHFVCWVSDENSECPTISLGSGHTQRKKTEGVWMSVTPTYDALVVALDFEGWLYSWAICTGKCWNHRFYRCTFHWEKPSRRCITCAYHLIHSIIIWEHIKQVLFNTAISNLVNTFPSMMEFGGHSVQIRYCFATTLLCLEIFLASSRWVCRCFDHLIFSIDL